jgi:hypothetical protein
MDDKLIEEMARAIAERAVANGIAADMPLGAYTMFAQACASILKNRIEGAYREGWHEGYATGDAGGSYSAVENDWLGSDARAALSPVGVTHDL